MIKINLKGTYRVKVAFDLFGKRITLWSKKGSFNESIDLGSDLHASRHHDFGPFEVFASVYDSALAIGVTTSDGLVELWSHKWPLKEIVNGKPNNLNIKAKGLEVKGVVSLIREEAKAA